MTRECAQEKIQRIHNAALNLAERIDINDLSIYSVAREAGIAASSVYHHYPNVEALVYRLTEEVLAGFEDLLVASINPDEVHHWSDINRQFEMAFANFYNENVFARKVILGHHTYHSVRLMDEANDLKLGKIMEEQFRRFYELPPLPTDVNIFSIAMQVADRVYSLGLDVEEHIPDYMIREAVRLTESYLGGYLPRYLPKPSMTADMANLS